MKWLTGIFALLGMPIFAVLGALSLFSFLGAPDESKRGVRFIAGNIIDSKFSDSTILMTIPLFVFVGYLMAESETPKRLVRAAQALLGWLPGGLALVCIFVSAGFTMLTGGSGVTIVAIGGLLLPALIKEGYPEKFSLGLVTAAGAVGLLFPPSPLVLVYSLVARLEPGVVFKATILPGFVLILILSVYSVWVAVRQKVPTQDFEVRELFGSWADLKWEAFAPLLVLGGLATGLMKLHESAAAAALYVLVIEKYIYRDLAWKKILKVAKDAMALSGAIIVILAMATALTNYVVHFKVPGHILAYFQEQGMSEMWQFIIALNIFLFILGMLMDAFSALLVALPLLVPIAASFGMPPFYLAVMFLLNLEIAYITPPVGLNLYIASFRFRRPVTEIYRTAIPFVGLLVLGLLIVIFVPRLSTVAVEGTIAELRAAAAKEGVAPREAWKYECIQEDPLNAKPCTDADIAQWGADGRKRPNIAGATPGPAGSGAPVKSDDIGAASVEDTTKLFFDDEPADGDKKDAGAPAPKDDGESAPNNDGAPPKDGKTEGATDKKSPPDEGEGDGRLPWDE